MQQPHFPDILGIIPARWGSTRFPGKPLADLNGRPIILRVWDQCLQAGLSRVVIATDDQRIKSVCEEAGAQVVMTDPELPSGTDRCAAIAAHSEESYVINIQGDEPFIDPKAIRQCADLLITHPDRPIATLARQETNAAMLTSPHVVKVVCDDHGKALYFSRAWIPFQRDRDPSSWSETYTYLTHIGLYGFKKSTLMELAKLPQSALETTEQLEQLRWLAAGYPISLGITDYRSLGIDTPEDLERARAFMS
ncbi:MAG: 3-deoxy-manno-octulosonate cytidylyltransferase [Saprospiraceae bacterium]|nr:3-deoxy-manno-octulosonate cytidylyltransferase [Saprospiraceae bacterium]